MANILELNNCGRGFIKLSNDLADALCKIDLSSREFRVFLAIFRLTAGWNVEAKRLSAEAIATKTHLSANAVSKCISSLLSRRVIFREGGARGDIGICAPNEWVFVVEKAAKTSVPNTAQSAEIVPLGRSLNVPETAQTAENGTLKPDGECAKNGRLHLYTDNKPLVNLPTVDITCPHAENLPAAVPVTKPSAKAAKSADRKSPFGITQMLADNPHNLPEQLLADWIAVRKAKRAAMTLTAWQKLNRELTALALRGVSAEQGLTVAVEAGWQGFEADWVVNRLSQGGGFAGLPVAAKPQAPDFHNGDTSWADALDMEDF